MKTKLVHLSAFLLLLGILFGSGCGGGGLSLSGLGAIFMTDGLDNHDHVWVTVKKAVLTSASGDFTIFNSPTGKTVDLKTLRDNSGERYSFLGTVPNGTYTGIKITLDKNVTLFSAGSTTGAKRVFAGNNGSTAEMDLNFQSGKQVGPNNNFALDFHLGSWVDNGTTVSGSPFLQEGQGNGINDNNRQEHDDSVGVIAGLSGTAPVQTFTMTHDQATVTVVTTAQTVISNCGTNAPLALANGIHVKVKGTFSVAQNAIVADSIHLKSDGDEDDQPQADGAVSLINIAAGTFTLTIHDADHFVPSATTVNVVTDANTIFTSQTGSTVTASVFLTALVDGTALQVEGTFDPVTNTLTATQVHFEDENNDHGGNTGGNTGGNSGGNTTG